MGRDKGESKKFELKLNRAKREVDASKADWGGADPAKVLDVIQIISSKGGAIRFGYTRDGGAYAIGLYMGGQGDTIYVRPSEDIDRYLSDLAEDLRDLGMP